MEKFSHNIQIERLRVRLQRRNKNLFPTDTLSRPEFGKKITFGDSI